MVKVGMVVVKVIAIMVNALVINISSTNVEIFGTRINETLLQTFQLKIYISLSQNILC